MEMCSVLAEGEEFLLYLYGCRFEDGRSLATGLRWILEMGELHALCSGCWFLRSGFSRIGRSGDPSVTR